ncbi:DUF1648 domain-containing protein [Streptomyces sp. MZ04]|uniref:DUF1648 domain-containing protein n=1 Tax=Streptomyces sp. MZ04 TaxID=2559236 RepID=UPI00107E800C|nr:DUF1648 domain-containing protein [Streptomyces sp. MZ04]TGA95542.1 DUF1648 domain-containing protein [Streptomyces sp. MZ04]
MNERARRGGGTAWAGAGWCAGVLVLLLCIPLAASGRLPDRLATHWGTGGEPDGSMPLWAAVFFPVLVWLVLVLAVVLLARRPNSGARGWAAISLASGGVFLVGGQASIVRANLDRSDWHAADSVTPWVIAAITVAVTAGALAWLATRGPATGQRQATGPGMSIPPDQQLAWFSRTSNRWLHATSAVTGFAALAITAVGAGGLIPLHAALIAPFAFTSLVVLGCSSVQVRVSEQGVKVSFGPLGWPARSWAVQDIESARVEHRTPAQVGGWGYRLSGLGTTVMLRGGECLVIRARGKDFAVSVDDAERGAGLLNALSAERAGGHRS